MKQTPIEWLINELQNEMGWGVDLGGHDSEIYNQIINNAKELEKTSMCSFTTGYVNNCVEIDHNEIELTKEVEEYYDWLESTKCQCDEGFCETQDNCKGLYSKI